jgi:copper homeostasis protein
MLEIIVETVADALAAAEGGADRLDLKSNFVQKGLTPSAGMIEEICGRVDIEVMAMIRPHTRSWVVDPQDLAVMQADIRIARSLGASGFLLGALTEDMRLDIPTVRAFKEAAGDLPIHFHLGWELAQDPLGTLEELISLSIQSVRTTGGGGPEGKVPENITNIRAYRDHADGRIELLLAGGVTPENVENMVTETGVAHVHSGTGVRTPASPEGAVDAAKVAKLRVNLDRAVISLR